MAKRKVRSSKTISASYIKKDLGSWNFIIFLTLAFILLVVIVSNMKSLALDLRTRAGLACPNALAAFNNKLPRPEDCSGLWKLSTDARGCQVFLCQSK